MKRKGMEEKPLDFYAKEALRKLVKHLPEGLIRGPLQGEYFDVSKQLFLGVTLEHSMDKIDDAVQLLAKKIIQTAKKEKCSFVSIPSEVISANPEIVIVSLDDVSITLAKMFDVKYQATLYDISLRIFPVRKKAA